MTESLTDLSNEVSAVLRDELAQLLECEPAHVDLTVSALARSATDKPAAYSVESNDTRHVVVYRSTDNEIREIRWTTNSVLIFVG